MLVAALIKRPWSFLFKFNHFNIARVRDQTRRPHTGTLVQRGQTEDGRQGGQKFIHHVFSCDLQSKSSILILHKVSFFPTFPSLPLHLILLNMSLSTPRVTWWQRLRRRKQRKRMAGKLWRGWKRKAWEWSMICQQILVLHYSRQHSSNVEDSSYDSMYLWLIGWYVSHTSWILAQLWQHIVHLSSLLSISIAEVVCVFIRFKLSRQPVVWPHKSLCNKLEDIYPEVDK